MKPHPRIRKTIKWGGAAVTVLLLVVWIGSGWFYSIRAARIAIGCAHGSLVVAPNGDGRSMPTWWWGWHFYRIPAGFDLWFSYKGEYDWSVPLWVLIAPLGASTALAWRADARAHNARARLNLCPKCNYDRAGIAADANCPECGCGGASGRPASNEPRTK
jgi:hypothetical protein